MSLAEQGYQDPPAILLDWLLEIEAVTNEVEAEQMRRASGNGHSTTTGPGGVLTERIRHRG